MLTQLRNLIMENLPVEKIFNKCGGMDYVLCKRSTVLEGARDIDYFVSKDGIKYKSNYYTNRVFGADYEEYCWDDLRPDDVVLDIGASIGAFTLRAAKTCKHVFAIEPMFPCELEENIRLNGLTNVTVLPIALGYGQKNAFIEFNKRSGHVPALTFDELLQLFKNIWKNEITFLKCDCEGAEWYINHYALNSIRRIEMEVHPKMHPTESSNPDLIPYIKEHWTTFLTHTERKAYVIHGFKNLKTETYKPVGAQTPKSMDRRI
jgi:FkbM family methyltransferase